MSIRPALGMAEINNVNQTDSMNMKPRSMKPLFFPIIDNGMGLSVTAWAVSMLAGTRGERLFCHVSSPYCGYAMDVATHHFLTSAADEMILIDTDLIFSPWDVRHLLEHDEPLVFGVYPKRKVEFDLPMEALPDNPRPFDQPGPLCEVAKTARGFMRVHRSVFEKMKPHVRKVEHSEFGPFYNFWPLSPDGTSEDYAFCAKWRELGGKVLVDKRILVKHAGQVQYPIEF